MHNIIPSQLPHLLKLPALHGAYDETQVHKDTLSLVEREKTMNKLVPSLEEAIRLSGLEDGMTISFHHSFREGDKIIGQVLTAIRELGIKSALTIKPNTPAEAVFPYLPLCDMILVMSVEPGFGGQKFMPSALPKLQALKAEIARQGVNCLLEIDGGINLDNAKEAADAGADVLVAGSAVFGAENVEETVKAFKSL